MSFKPRTKVLLASLLFAGWLISSSIILFRFGFLNYGVFDPQQEWAWQQQSLSLTELQLPTSTGWQLIHVLDDSCGCSRLARQHISLFSDDYGVAAEQQYFMSAIELANAGFPLPAIPAVLLFHEGQLMYAGPYASGPLCSPSKSFLTALLSGQTNLPGTWLNGETKACRCLVSAAAK